MKGLRDRDRDDVANSLKLPRNLMTCIKKGHGPGNTVKSNIGLAERIASFWYVTYYTAGSGNT